MIARHIELRRTFNLRDLGGYTTRDGRRVRWRRLFRGAGLHRLSGPDAAEVEALGLRTVIDLRTPRELEARGRYPLAAEVVHQPMISALWDPADLREDEPAWCYLLRRYQEMLEEGRPAVARTLEILARPGSYPAVFFCAAGKDRTGVLAALVLGLLGVPDEEIVSDYHLSGEPVARIVAQARSRESFMVEQPAALMACPPEAMRSTLAWIRDRYGSLEDYAGGADVGALRASLLEAA